MSQFVQDTLLMLAVVSAVFPWVIGYWECAHKKVQKWLHGAKV